MTRCAIYARYSSERQNERSSEDQIRICKAYAENQGWHVVQSYSDDAISGTAMANRPGINEALEGVASDDGLLSVLDRLVLFEIFVELDKRLIDALAAVFVRQDVKQPRELAAPAGPQSLRGIPQGRQIDPPQMVGHFGGEAVLTVLAAPAFRLEPPPLVGIAVADREVRLHCPVRSGTDSRHELSLVIEAETAECVFEQDRTGGFAALGMVNVIGVEPGIGFVNAAHRRSLRRRSA